MNIDRLHFRAYGERDFYRLRVADVAGIELCLHLKGASYVTERSGSIRERHRALPVSSQVKMGEDRPAGCITQLIACHGTAEFDLVGNNEAVGVAFGHTDVVRNFEGVHDFHMSILADLRRIRASQSLPRVYVDELHVGEEGERRIACALVGIGHSRVGDGDLKQQDESRKGRHDFLQHRES